MDRSLLQSKHSTLQPCCGQNKAKCHHSGPPMMTIVKMFDHHQVNAGRPRKEYRHGGNPSSQVPETMHCKSLSKQSRRTNKWTKCLIKLCPYVSSNDVQCLLKLCPSARQTGKGGERGVGGTTSEEDIVDQTLDRFKVIFRPLIDSK